ncbi:MAG: hypothetical protein ACI3XD_04425 [Oscillospiraceae bacterium]
MNIAKTVFNTKGIQNDLLGYVLFATIMLVSYMVSAMAVLTPIMVLRVSFPLARSAKKALPEDSGVDSLFKLHWLSLIIWVVIDTAIAVVVALLVPRIYAYAALMGACGCALFSLGKTGRTNINRGEYIETNEKYIKEEYRKAVESVCLDS